MDAAYLNIYLSGLRIFTGVHAGAALLIRQNSLAWKANITSSQGHPIYWNVLQPATVPCAIPRLNHCVRWTELPCVNDSGVTRPVDIRCRRSSPTAAAAFMALSASPFSRRLRWSVEWAHTPARQSACNSILTES